MKNEITDRLESLRTKAYAISDTLEYQSSKLLELIDDLDEVREELVEASGDEYEDERAVVLDDDYAFVWNYTLSDTMKKLLFEKLEWNASDFLTEKTTLDHNSVFKEWHELAAYDKAYLKDHISIPPATGDDLKYELDGETDW